MPALQTMIPQNKINQKEELQQSRLVAAIKAYLSARFFQIATHFETRTHLNLPYLDYQLAKLPHKQPQASFEARAVGLLAGGLNRNVKITVQLVRAIQFEFKVFCLVWDKFQQSEARFYPLVVVFSSASLAEEWCSKTPYLTKMVVFSPFVSFESCYKGAFLVVRHDCVDAVPAGLAVKKWQLAKSMANESFKRKSFKLALVLYELALGLLWSFSQRRDRAILHSNMAQSFFELNLCENTLLYADTAINLNRGFAKSYYRKLCSLLQLQKYAQIPQLLMLMTNICSKDQFTAAHERYTRYMANKTGVYNWHEIITKRSKAFGQYTSQKIKMTDSSQDLKKHRKFSAAARIKKYELVAVQKVAISFEEKSSSKDTNMMPDFFDQIYEFLQLEQRFSERIQEMLSNQGKKVEDNLSVKVFHYARTTQAIGFSHCFKTVYACQHSVAMCPQITYFLLDEESPNCTFLNLNGAFFYFAVRDIEPNEILTIQLFNKTIQSPHSSLLQFASTGKRGLEAYYSQKQTFFQKKKYNHCVRYLWRMFRDTVSRVKVTEEILEIVKHYPQWEIIILVLCQLQMDPNFPLAKRCQDELCNILQRFFSLSGERAGEVLDGLIYG